MANPINLNRLRVSNPLSGGGRRASNKTIYLIKRILITNLMSLVLLGLTYIWIVYLLSNAASFWDIFRGKDVYVDKDTVPPIAPYLNPVPEATKDDFI